MTGGRFADAFRGELYTTSEAAAIDADGGSLAAATGRGPEVVEPTHRLTDLPDGVIAAVVEGGVGFREAMAAATGGEEQ